MLETARIKRRARDSVPRGELAYGEVIGKHKDDEGDELGGLG